MKHYALISNGTVVNIVVLDDGGDPAIFAKQCDEAVLLPERPEIGWMWDGKQFSLPTPADIAAGTVFDAQLIPNDIADLLTALNRSGLGAERIAELADKITPESAPAVMVSAQLGRTP